MVGLMAVSWGERAATLLDGVKKSATIPSKLEQLRQLKEVILRRDPFLLPEYAPQLAELPTGQPSPVRRLVAEAISEIGIKSMELLPEIVPTLVYLLKDETPAVTRQAIVSGTTLFHNVLEKLVIQGIHSSELDHSLDLSWESILKFKDAVFPIAFQHGSDGVRLLAIKFIEAMILLYTPDPNISSEPPSQIGDGLGFNISWVRGCHPVLNVGELATEASKSLGMLLDQLRFPQVKSLSNSIIIVLINCLSAIARKRPSFYGRVLPVLLTLDPATAVVKGMEVSGAYHALKSAFLTCLQCTHPAAAPWRSRLVEALRAMDAASSTELPACVVEMLPVKDDNFMLVQSDEVPGDLARKRSIKEESSGFMQDNIASGKRARTSPVVSQEAVKESTQANPDLICDNIPLMGTKASTGGGDNGPVQQLVGMFGALVAQGDKAVESLDILISSISSDLLAEVVMANLQHLPTSCPKSEEEQEQYGGGYTSSLVCSNQTFIRPSFKSDILSLSSALAMISSQSSATHDTSKLQVKDEVKQENVVDASLASPFIHDTKEISPDSIQSVVPTAVETGTTSNAPPCTTHNSEMLESRIPGLESVIPNEIEEPVDISQSSTSELQGSSQEQVISSGSKMPCDTTASGLMSTYVSETPSSSATVMDSGLSAFTGLTSLTVSSQYILPKMTAPVISLTDEQKDHIQKVAFLRIVEAYKQVVVAGGIQMRFSLLACLGVEFPLEFDVWGLLQKHILSDYLNHEGHELTLQVLYRLFRESEQDQDFFSSTTAISVYETFLLTVAETLRDSFPASDKSLSRLLGEVPYLPKSIFKLLECMCSPENIEKDGKEFQGGDRVTQGLSTIWGLILLRPSSHDTCLKIALQSAVHDLEEVRMKAIRLVANKLYPMSAIAGKIEEFANEMLLSVVDHFPAKEGSDTEGLIVALPKDADSGRHLNAGPPSGTVMTNEIPSDSQELCKSQIVSSSSISEAQRRMSLYFALCTKKHSLLQQLFTIYRSIPKLAKQAVHGHIPILVRTIGCSADLLKIISDLPDGCQILLMQVLHTLTDGTIPSTELVSSVRKLYESKLKDVEILIPVLSSLSKEEVLPIFPKLVNLPMDKFQIALARILQGSSHSGPSLTPAEVLIAIHEIDPEKDCVPLKKVMDACSACFEQRQVFTQQVLAKALNQLVEQIPLPLLFMRTVIQAIGVFPALVDFAMEILSRLVNKQIWKYPKLWVGFLKCALQTKPQSFNVLLQLPAAQLENALNRNPVLKNPLIEHANQPNVRSTLPRTTLVVLGLSSDSHASSQAQTTQSQPPEIGNSGADGGTETTQESTDVS
uniref:Symplekin n=1 Tax=Anthurium amnicola TaxID=1678845 RepID=A0A1D1XLC0_9ARAE